jgi:hypothetical protein
VLQGEAQSHAGGGGEEREGGEGHSLLQQWQCVSKWQLKERVHEIFDFRFFHESISAEPLVSLIPLVHLYL